MWPCLCLPPAACQGTLAVAFTVSGVVGGVLVIILLIIQFLAMVW